MCLGIVKQSQSESDAAKAAEAKEVARTARADTKPRPDRREHRPIRPAKKADVSSSPLLSLLLAPPAYVKILPGAVRGDRGHRQHREQDQR